MTIFDEGLTGIVEGDPRYAYEAYEFLFHALHHTQKKLGRLPANEPELTEIASANPRHHVSGQELVQGACDLALQEFGFLARTVFKMWGIERSDDFGELVFNLIDAGLMSKTDQDRKEDFQNVVDLDKVLVQGYHLRLDEARE